MRIYIPIVFLIFFCVSTKAQDSGILIKEFFEDVFDPSFGKTNRLVSRELDSFTISEIFRSVEKVPLHETVTSPDKKVLETIVLSKNEKKLSNH